MDDYFLCSIIKEKKKKFMLSFSDVLILVNKIQLELAKSSASLQPNRKLVRPVCSKHIKRVSTLVVYYY